MQRDAEEGGRDLAIAVLGHADDTLRQFAGAMSKLTLPAADEFHPAEGIFIRCCEPAVRKHDIRPL